MGTFISQSMTTENGAEAARRTDRDFISAVFETMNALVVNREGAPSLPSISLRMRARLVVPRA